MKAAKTITKKILFVLPAVILAAMLMLSSCSGSGAAEEASGQNPAMNFIGNYACGRASVMIGAIDQETGMTATVTWGSSAWENSVWTMSGTFDPETLRFEYNDCVRTNYVYEESGDVASQEEVYTGGHGFMTFAEADPLTLTWQDDQEDAAADMVFEYTGMMPGDAGLGGDTDYGLSADDLNTLISGIQ